MWVSLSAYSFTRVKVPDGLNHVNQAEHSTTKIIWYCCDVKLSAKYLRQHDIISQPEGLRRITTQIITYSYVLAAYSADKINVTDALRNC